MTGFYPRRNSRRWRLAVKKEKQKRDAEEMGDAMKSLKNRTLDSKREMDGLAALNLYELKSMKSRHATVSVDAMLEALQHTKEEQAKKIEEEDEAAIRAYKGFKEKYVKRIHDEDDEEDEDDFGSGTLRADVKRQKTIDTAGLGKPTDSDSSDTQGGSKPSKDWKFLFKSPSVTITVLKKSGDGSSSNKPMVSEESSQETRQNVVSNNGLQLLCQEYGSDDDE